MYKNPFISSPAIIEDVLLDVLDRFTEEEPDFTPRIQQKFKEYGFNADIYRASSFYKAIWWYFLDRRELAPAMKSSLGRLDTERYKAVDADYVRQNRGNILDTVYEREEVLLKANLEGILHK
ncbi:hypothetical protein HYX14_04270 [Candidatus Woesearchaeota archaeon]|nr:hypothetical protein [Candidatus Woesearchaeota archaeon]